MDLTLSPEQRQLEAGVARLLAERCSFEARQKSAAASPGWSAALWDAYAEMGLLAIAVPEAHGGMGGGGADLLPVMQGLGGALALEPFLASAVLGTTALATVAADADAPGLALACRWLPQLATGEKRLAFAHEEAGVAPGDAQLQARRTGSGWALEGLKQMVLHAADAHGWIVTARTAAGPDGLALFHVDAAAAGVSQRDLLLVDQRRAAVLRFDGAIATLLLGPSPTAAWAIRRVLDVGVAALCAEAVGAMRTAFDMTTRYLATRRQFGRPLADNQALRHRCAEMLASIETCEAMACLAAATVDASSAPDTTDPDRDIARAKLLVGRHGRWVGEQAVQLHGGIGMTDEYAVGHCLQRLVVIDSLLGHQDAQLDRLLAA